MESNKDTLLSLEKTQITKEAFAAVDSQTIPKRGKGHGEDFSLVNSNRNLAIITDGMGGPEDAHKASERVAQLIEEALRNIGPLSSPEEIVKCQEHGFTIANQQIKSEFPNTGTTATAISLWSKENQKIGVITWAGDSRVYLIRHGHIERLTEDQDGVTKKILETDIHWVLDETERITTYDELKKASSLAREVLAGRAMKIQPSHIGDYFGKGEDLFTLRSRIILLAPSDKVLLVTDGISDNLTPKEILDNSKNSLLLASAAEKRSEEEGFRSTPDDATALILTV